MSMVLVFLLPLVGSGEDEPADDGARVRDGLREAEALLRAAAASDDDDLRVRGIERLGAIDAPAALEALLRLGLEHLDDPAAAAIRRALGRARRPGSIAFLDEQLKRSRSTGRAILILEALETIPGDASARALLTALTRESPPALQVTTLRALRNKSTPEVIDALVEFYGHAWATRGQVWVETRLTLYALTGQRYVAHEDWVNWWTVTREHWTPSAPYDPGALTGVTPGTEQGDPIELPTIFGREITSQRIAFVLDVSESMQIVDPPRGGAEEGSQGRELSRLERARRELVQAIHELPGETEFNIVTFSSYARPWKKGRLVPASAASKRAATDHVKGLSADGKTSTLDALLLAMELPEVDTILLLSDGSPTNAAGKVVDADIERIHREVNRRNRFRKITIHTLGFPGALVSFMQKLARDNGGTYSSIR